jgi:hypothetical protein
MKRESVLRMSMVAVPVMIGCGLVVALPRRGLVKDGGQLTTTETPRPARIEPFMAITDPPSKA